MNTIIALKGKANTGNTTTINLLPAIMVANGYHQVPGKYQRHGVDFLDIFENGTNLVGITSAGDTYHAVYDRLNDLVESCALFVLHQ